MKKKRIRIHKQTLHLLSDPQYIYIWVHPEERAIAICVCDKSSKDAVKILPKRECEIYSTELFVELGRLQPDWSSGSTYRIQGMIENTNMIAKFYLRDNSIRVNNQPEA